jgi:hypothetical protein
VDHKNGNGNTVRGCDGGVQRVTITCTPGTQKLGVDMDCLSLDIALSLLERAHRELESRFRFMRAQELVMEAQEQQRLAAIAAGVARGAGHRG